MDRPANSPLTSRQRRHLQAARKAMGEVAGVRAFAAGRANARWSAAARWGIGILIVAFTGALVLLHVVLLPGALVLYVLYDTVRPRRGVAVTVAGVSELKLSMVSGRPSSVLATTSHAALLESHIDRVHGKSGVRFGTEYVSLRDRDLKMLQAAIPEAVPSIAQPDPGTPPLPPPPPARGAGPGLSAAQMTKGDRSVVSLLFVHR